MFRLQIPLQRRTSTSLLQGFPIFNWKEIFRLKKIVCPKKRTAIGCKAFDHIGENMLNQLPTELRSADNLKVFMQKLKTRLFQQYYYQ